MNIEVKDFLVYLIELCADEYFNGNKSLAYNELKKHNLLDFYKNTYDTSHTLSSAYILNEISEKLNTGENAI